ncbi:BLOC-1-related complex subunit 7 isoform X1 [Panthera uncia]|uniref:BLOC-1-related complex subunit 7 isoform X1 n=1 Tax=Panthera uncia TaxID=29064 RepID=UPI0020FF8B24|nr:BLOC-1-related complex subunit 7 isoform X1 [Panthera uncia]
MATGTPDSQARFGQSVKGLLTEKVNTCGTDVIALTKQVLKGSRSSELLGQAARNMVLQEDAILHSEDSLRKMAIITTHLQYQQEAIQKNSGHDLTAHEIKPLVGLCAESSLLGILPLCRSHTCIFTHSLSLSQNK